jgi:tetratricopeptide (TPR) repeat protein
VISSRGHAAPHVDVEIRDTRGYRLATSATDVGGGFSIQAPSGKGTYILLASTGPTLVGQQILWQGGETEFNITLPDLPSSTRSRPDDNTVSVNRLATSEKTRKYIQRAQNEFTQLHTDEALRSLDAALQVDPRCAAAFTMRAFIRLATRDFNGALDDATRATSLDPDNTDSYIALSTALNSTGQFQKGAEAAAQGLMLDIDSWQARLELAKSLYGQNHLVLALHELDLLDVDFADVRLVRANVLMRLGRREEGRTEFAGFLENFPEDPRGPQVRAILSTQ